MKKFLLVLFSSIVVMLLSVIAIVYIADPFFQYHESWFGMEPYMSEAVYQTPGAARNFKYDSAIVGSSMSENFSADYFDEVFGWNTAKLSYSGIRTNDYRAIFDQIYYGDRKVDNIVMTIDMYTYIEDSNLVYADRPEYLYTPGGIDDINYIFNKDVFTKAVTKIWDHVTQNEIPADRSYYWGDANFGINVVLDQYYYYHMTCVKNYYPTDYFIENCRRNMANITPVIEAHPETTFYLYFPPYSVLYWDIYEQQGNIEAVFAAYEEVVSTYIQYDNVKLYYFMNATEMITKVENYRDTSHHCAEYNKIVTDDIADGRFLLSKENYEEELAKTRDFVKTYDYKGWFEAQGCVY